MILYPTETVYGLGVGAFDNDELQKLYYLKGRDAAKAVSWLVRDVSDMEEYAVVSSSAKKIAESFLPGQLTLVLPVRNDCAAAKIIPSGMVGVRISADSSAQKLIGEFMAEHDMPLTCTSANISGLPTLPTPQEILTQFGEKAELIDIVIDDGPRSGTPSAVVQVVGDEVKIIRAGEITQEMILGVL